MIRKSCFIEGPSPDTLDETLPMAENNMVMVYDKLHLTLAEGDKVLCVSEGKFGAAPGEHVAFYDIFRLENGKIVEHWDNIQTIPSDGQWANPNGKFGF